MLFSLTVHYPPPQNQKCVVLSFATASTFPEAIIEQLVTKFPALDFYVKAFDDSGEELVSFKGENGVIRYRNERQELNL